MRALLTLLLLGLALKATPQVVKAEYFFDDAAIAYGQGTSLTVPSNPGDVQIMAELPLTGLSSGFHQVFFRVKDALEGWSSLTRKTFLRLNPDEMIVGFSYCFDAGTEAWTYKTFPTPATDVSMNAELELGNLAKGIHYFEAMAKSAIGEWTPIAKGTFFNNYAKPLNITALEYYFEDESGVAGSIFTMNNFTPSPNVTLDSVTFSIPVGSLENLKKYYVYLRAVDEVGNRSFYVKDTIVYHKSTTGVKDLIYLTPEIMIFPNPVDEMVNLKFVPLDYQSDFIIRIFDGAGRLILVEEFSFSETDHYVVDASKLVPGVYTIAIYTTEGKPTARATFIKK
jgi:hypothetical protein